MHNIWNSRAGNIYIYIPRGQLEELWVGKEIMYVIIYIQSLCKIFTFNG